jgi:hypothetical protein
VIATGPLPRHALLERYAADGGYTDCFTTDLPGSFSHAEYVAAFYTSWLFRLERFILRWLVARPSTDAEARQLAHGERDSFAAWTVEAAAPNQLLMCDYQGKTRSWFMIEPRHEGGATRLYFGTAIVSRSFIFRMLLGFHKKYSRALLTAARSRLVRHA